MDRAAPRRNDTLTKESADNDIFKFMRFSFLQGALYLLEKIFRPFINLPWGFLGAASLKPSACSWRSFTYFTSKGF